jgi:uncharacterized membrane protein YtjA (UPF0391 family)
MEELFVVASMTGQCTQVLCDIAQVFILSLNDLLNQVGDFLLPSAAVLADASNPSGDTLCQVQSWMESFFELSSPMWTTAIAATLYMSVIMRRSGEQIESSFRWMVVVCIGIPLILTIVPGALGYYGVAGAWCWIADAHAEWRFYQFFLPLLACILFNGYVYFRVICAIRATVKASEEASSGGRSDPTAMQMRQIVGRLLRYPLILVIVWFFAAVNRATEAATGGEQIFVLYMLQKFFSSSQGFLNALAYGFSAGVQEAVRADLALICPCVKDSLDRQMLPVTHSASGARRGGSRGSAGESRLERDLGAMESAEEGDDDDFDGGGMAEEYGVEVEVGGLDDALPVDGVAVTNPVVKAGASPAPVGQAGGTAARADAGGRTVSMDERVAAMRGEASA